MNNAKRLEGKVALVTGGGSGIGSSITLALTEAGARVVLTYHSSERGASEVMEQVRMLHGEALAVHADLTEPGDLQSLVDAAIDRFGAVDILVNNAGVAVYTPFLEMPLDVWTTCLQVNLTAAFILSQRVAVEMVRKSIRGSIVNISSLGGSLVQDGLVHYNASKGGLNLLTKSIALALGPYGIRVNAIAPGAIEVERNRASLVEGDYPQQWKKTIPLGRWGQPRDVARVVLFLCSEESGFVTGHILTVDGGQSVQVLQPPYDFARWEKRSG